MGNKWITAAPEDSWLEPEKSNPSPLKDLDTIQDERQKISETPEPEPVPVPVEPVEEIPYDQISGDLAASAKDVIAANLAVERASAALGKIATVVNVNGPKGKEILSKVNDFKAKLEVYEEELEDLGEEIVAYKNMLPKESAPQV